MIATLFVTCAIVCVINSCAFRIIARDMAEGPMRGVLYGMSVFSIFVAAACIIMFVEAVL